MNKRKLLERLQNSSKNVKYNDFVVLIEAFGFRIIRTNGSHNVYEREDVPDMVNIQNDKGKAKSYQIKQFLSLVEIHNLSLEDDQ